MSAELAAEVAAYQGLDEAPTTTQQHRPVFWAEHEALVSRVALLEQEVMRKGDATGNALELMRKESLAGVEHIKAQVRGLKLAVEASTEEKDEHLAAIDQQLHLIKHALNNSEHHRQLLLDRQESVNTTFVREHNRTRRFVRAVNVARGLVLFALAMLAANIRWVLEALVHAAAK